MLKKQTAAALLICFSLLLFLGCGKSFLEEDYSKTVETARTVIWQQLSAGASSATAAIMDGGKIVYCEGFGMRDREKSIPVDPNTQFNIGSVSKIFTAASVLVLVEEGKLELDRPVADYLPKFTMQDERYRNITVRMLLNHSSGMPGSYAKNGYTTAPDTDNLKNTLAYLSQRTLVDNPGEISIYCNNGFILAQALIEKVSGKSYADFVSKNLFEKADMSNSSCYFKDGNINIARVYNPATGRIKPLEYANLMGTGGISSTAVDLCRYANALLSGKIMDAELFREYTAPQYAPYTVPAGTPLYQYGLGWDTVSVDQFVDQGVWVVSKNGATATYSSMLYVLPEEDIAFSVIFAGRVDTTEVANAIVQALLEEKGVLPTEEKETAPPAPAPLPDDFSSYEGVYGSSERITQVSFDAASGSMDLSFFKPGGFVQSGRATYREDGYFYLDNGSRLSLAQDRAGTKCLLIHSADTDGGMVWAEKLDKSLGKADTLAFEGKIWLPVNLAAGELSVYSAQTGAIPGLSGYIYIYMGGTYVPYALKSENEARYSMKYARDQGEPRISYENGKADLNMMGLVFGDAGEAAALASGEPVVIENQNINEIRRIEKDGLLKVQLPEGGRAIVFSPGLDIQYDSLMDGETAVFCLKGSYIVFVGDQGAAFTYDIKS
jgi:CubicO group peptidase (beta-lactamase class C family)